MRTDKSHIRKKTLSAIAFLFIIVLVSSCASSGFSSENGPFYNGADVNIESGNLRDDRKVKAIEQNLEDVIVPGKVPWIARQKFNLLFRETEKNNLRNFLKNKIGKAPLYYKNVTPPERNVKNIQKLLAANGYFNAHVTYNENLNKIKMSIMYNVHLPEQYTIKKVTYPHASSAVTTLLNREKENSLIHSGDGYNLNKLSEERKRLVKVLKQNGFYKMNEAHLYFKADSNLSAHQVNLSLHVKPENDNRFNDLYCINKIYLKTSYNISDVDSLLTDTIVTNDLVYIGDSSLFNPRLFDHIVLIRHDSLYSLNITNLTIKRLLSLNIFNAVNISYKEVPDTNVLNCYIDCILKKEYSINLDLHVTSKSNSFTGPGIKAEYQLLNVFGAAENLKLRLTSGFETQLNNSRKGFETYQFGGDVEYKVPRLMLPVKFKRGYTPKPPQTIFNLGYENLKRRGYYTMNSFYLNAGYMLYGKQNKMNFEIYPVIVNYTKPGKTTATFNTILQENPFYARSFQQNFILGSQYNIINSLGGTIDSKRLLIRTSFETSGNIYNFLNEKLQLGIEKTYSQFTKISIDTRYYLHLLKSNHVIFRCFSGVGLPYGNSESLPYIKQFYAGGPNSIRAFPSRSLGPGTFERPESTLDNPYFEQSGDVKIELNVEYRFPIARYFKGAIFTDIGNIWLVNEHEDVSGGQFEFDSFYDQLAIGSGIGLRFDVSYFVLRLDLATPLRKPYLDNTWQMENIRLNNKNWRKNNLVFNLAIGYPF